MTNKVKCSTVSQSCPFCENSFKTASHLHQHIQRHTREKPFNCGTCAKDFFTNYHLKRHASIHMNTRPNKGRHPQCSSTCNRKSDLIHRDSWTQKKYKHVECVFCKRAQQSKYYCRHLLTHIKEKWHFCKICGDEKNCSQMAKQHYLRYHTDDNSLKCETCQKQFANNGSLLRHNSIVHRNGRLEKYLVRCAECHEMFSDHRSLQKHKRIHGIEMPYNCSFCDKGFYTYPELNLHIRCHTGEKPYKCDKCPKEFTSNNGMNNHLKTHDITREKHHHCSECTKSFYSAVYLKRHNKRVHQRERLKECVFCKASFYSITKLSNHLRIHTLERPFICNVCGFESKGTEMAKVHFLRYHISEPPYKCEHCLKSFFMASSLREHQIKFHNGNVLNVTVVVKNHLLFESD